MKLRLLGAAAVALLLAGGAARADGELHIFNWGDYTNPKLIEKFQKQYNVKVTATGFASTDVINLSIDGAAPNAQVGQPADGGSVTFSGFTLPEGMHSLAARSSDGEIRSEAVMLNVDTTPPAVAFTSPIGGGTLTTADDTDPNSTGIQFDVKVDAAVEDGQQVLLTLTAPSGAITHVTPVAAAGGKATFTHVSFGEMGTWKLRADATTTCGNPGFATIDIGVGVPPSVPCAVEITPAPVNRPGIANVLNYDLDPDKVKAGFQATIKVRSTAGNNADLFINLLQTGSRTAVGSDGTATFAVDLAEGLGSIQAQCRDTSQNVGASTNNLVFVDTTRPTCAITAPANGKILIPADDIQPGTPGTTEFNVAATVTGTPAQPSGSDTDGELAQFSIDGAVQTATVAGNAASVVGSLGAPKVTVPIEVSGIDRAGNTCTAAITVGYETQGCSIGLSAPTSTVTTDSVNGKAGVQATVVFDIGAACSGFIYSATVAESMIAAGAADTALIVGVEKLSGIMDWKDRSTCVLFGDGAGAAVLKRSKQHKGILSSFLRSDGTLADLLCRPSGGVARPVDESVLADRSQYIKMNGREVFKNAVRSMSDAATRALDAAKLTGADIDLMIPHQANVRIIEATAKHAGIPMDKVYVNVDRYGNTSAASVPIALDEALERGVVGEGSTVLLVAFGAGFTWGSMVVRL